MAINTMIELESWYHDLILERKRPNGHKYHD